MLVMLSIVSLTPSIAASAVLPCSITTVGVFSKFGALGANSTVSRTNVAPSLESHSDSRNMHSGSFAGITVSYHGQSQPGTGVRPPVVIDIFQLLPPDDSTRLST